VFFQPPAPLVDSSLGTAVETGEKTERLFDETPPVATLFAQTF
jgi:hypothetical protein